MIQKKLGLLVSLSLLAVCVACSSDGKDDIGENDQEDPQEQEDPQKNDTTQLPIPIPPISKYLPIETISVPDFDIEFEMVYVEGGTFSMGEPNSLYLFADKDESPAHQVTLSSYYIGKYHVTQEIWEKVMGEKPAQFVDPQNPIFHVNWYDCMEFIDSLNIKTGKNFKLPTEAQWEFAARGGNETHGYLYAGSDSLELVSWYNKNAYYVGKTNENYGIHKVGSKQPNELGIYDMSGNVWNWCRDYYADYTDEPSTNPEGPETGEKRVSRGGSWTDAPHGCRVSDRWGYNPNNRETGMSFRVVYEIDDK